MYNKNSDYSMFVTKLFPSKIFILITFFTCLTYSQSLQELKTLEAKYKKQQLMENELSQENLNETNSNQSTQIIYKPADIKSFYVEELNKLVNNIKDIEEISNYIDSTRTLDYFGYDFFSQRDSAKFWDNLPLSNNYQLGVGDELYISIWGEVERTDQKIINRDGSVFIEDVGFIPLSGKTLDEANKIISLSYENTYATLKGENAKSYLNVSLGKLKGLNVHFYGAVKKPGVYAVHPFSTIITGLIQAGGIDTTGSLRKIALIRDGKNIHEFDLYAPLTKGLLGKDIKLLNQDAIFITNRQSTVAISGEIYRPGYFELKSNETLKDLINYAGGLKPKSLDKVLLNRIDSNNSNVSINNYQINISDLTNFSFIDGDSIFVPKIENLYKSITISGQVLSPGEYTYTKGMKVLDALTLTGQLDDSTWWQSADISKTMIVRQDSLGLFNNISVDLRRLILGDITQNKTLKPFDRILIPKNINFTIGKFITLTGEVLIPGNYLINNSSVRDIIKRAGGFSPSAFPNGVQIFRDSLQIAWTNLDFPLTPNDSIYVPTKTNTVKILGAVNNEGYYTFNKKLSLKQYIESAGGFTVYANRKDVVVIFPNGIAKRKRRFFSPKVLEGSTIIVSGNDLIVSQPDYLEISSQVASIIGSLATVAIIVKSQSQ